MDDARAGLRSFGAQLGIRIALAIDFTAVVLLAIVEHPLPALGEDALIVQSVALGRREGRGIHRRRRWVGLLGPRRARKRGGERESKDQSFHDAEHGVPLLRAGFSRIAPAILIAAPRPSCRFPT